MRRALLALALTGLSGCAGWSNRDMTMMAANVACHATDFQQTRWALDHGYLEANPLLGHEPSTGKMLGVKTVGIFLIWDIGEAAGPDERFNWLTAAMVPCSAAIIHNYAIGARGF